MQSQSRSAITWDAYRGVFVIMPPRRRRTAWGVAIVEAVTFVLAVPIIVVTIVALAAALGVLH